jgi:hypothetical protein
MKLSVGLAMVAVGLLPVALTAQPLYLHNDIQTHAALTNRTVTLTGRAELRITGSGDPLPGCTIHLNSPDAWLRLTAIEPSQVASRFLSRVLVNGSNAVLNSNVRVVQYQQGAVVIPHAPDYAALEVFENRYFAGQSSRLKPFVQYSDANMELGTNVASFKLKRGYQVTLATQMNGTGISRNYVAQDGDLEISRLPAALEKNIRFIRVFPWRWTSKKGIAGNLEQYLDVDWLYNWNLDRNSALDWEYVPIRQSRYWPGLDQDWRQRGATHLLGYNEPDRPDQANMSVADALASWPDLLGTGLRVGSPAVSDGGRSGWLYPFMQQADAAGLRVDFVAVHYYWCYNPADPNGAANQMYNFLLEVYNNTRRPIWVTEWNNGANWTGCGDPTYAQQAAAIAAMVDMLNNAPFVERYAPFNWVEDVRRLAWDDGWPTQAGEVYRDRAAPLAYRQQRPDSGIGRTTRFRFDGSFMDDGGNGQDAMPVGTPRFAPGRFGQAVMLDGVDDYLQLPANVGNSTDFTFAAWVYWNGGGRWQRIFDLGDLLNLKYLYLSPDVGGSMRFTITDNGWNSEQRINAPVLATGVWTHVAVTLGGTTGKLFINGRLVASNTSMTVNPDSLGVQYNYLGHSRFPADPNFNGLLDDVRFLTSALSDAAVAALAASLPPTFNVTSLAVPDAFAFCAYTNSIAAFAFGGVGTRTFSKMDGPAWLNVAVDGTLSGVPTAADGGWNRFVVRVTDEAGGAHMTELALAVTNLSGLPATTTARINGSAQDAEEAANGTVNLTSTDLELVEDGGPQIVGLRFELQVPQGAVITDARLQFTADESQSGPTSLSIATEAADSAAAFTNTTGNLSARVRNELTVPWQPGPWTAGDAGIAQQTPNLAGLVQAVVSRPGWQPGNAIVFLITGIGHRTADAFDKSGGSPAVLRVSFLTPTPLYSVTATISHGTNDAEQAASGTVNLTSTDLELVNDSATSAGDQIVGLRFDNLAIPPGALITSAYVQFTADETNSSITTLTIRAEAADSAAGFLAVTNNLGARPVTQASVAWSPAPWMVVNERGPLQRTPNLAPVLQEVIARPGWTNGGAVVLLISGSGCRTADAADEANGQPATLTVYYRQEVPLGTYDHWAAGRAEVNTPAEDGDRDGYANLMEYALGLNPAVPEAGALSVESDAAILHLIYPRPALVNDLSYTVEWADSIYGPWSVAGVVQEIIADDGVIRRVRATVPKGQSSQRFVRLKVTKP